MGESSNNSKAPEYAVLVIGVLLLWDKIFGKSDEEKKRDEELEKEKNKLFTKPQGQNPTLEGFKDPPKKTGQLLVRPNLSSYTGDGPGMLRKSIGNGFYISRTDASNIINTIKKYITKSEMSVLFKTYSFVYKRDLMNDLRKAFDSPDTSPAYKDMMQDILNYINNLPDYVK